jgi:hypothetical protein
VALVGIGTFSIGIGTFSNRAKWRSSPSACESVFRNYLTAGGIVRDACLH